MSNYNKYYKEISEWNWDDIVHSARANPHEDDDDNIKGYELLGTVMCLAPSRKYYTPIACSNVTEEEANEDAEYMKALEKIAEEYGGWIEEGQGDPCNVLFVLMIVDSSWKDLVYEPDTFTESYKVWYKDSEYSVLITNDPENKPETITVFKDGKQLEWHDPEGDEVYTAFIKNRYNKVTI